MRIPIKLPHIRPSFSLFKKKSYHPTSKQVASGEKVHFGHRESRHVWAGSSLVRCDSLESQGSLLVDESEEKNWHLTPLVTKGAEAKFRLACDDAGKIFAVREYRLDRQSPSGLDSVSQALREAQISDALQSPLGRSQFIKDNTHLYEVAELGGGTLVDLLKLPVEQRIYLCQNLIFPQIARDLCILHQYGIIHADIKLENILWFHDGHCHLMDFGMAIDGVELGQALSENRQVTTRGTFAYLAPDWAEEATVTTRIDSWSLGILLLELLRGCDSNSSESEKIEPNNLFFAPGENHTLVRLGSKFHEFQKWYSKRVTSSGLLLADILKGSDPFDLYLQPIVRVAPRLCQFAVQRLLHSDPRKRAGSQEILDFFHVEPQTFSQARTQLKDLGYSTGVEQVINQLKERSMV